MNEKILSAAVAGAKHGRGLMNESLKELEWNPGVKSPLVLPAGWDHEKFKHMVNTYTQACARLVREEAKRIADLAENLE